MSQRIPHRRCGLRDKPHGPHRFRWLIMWGIVYMPCQGRDEDLVEEEAEDR